MKKSEGENKKLEEERMREKTKNRWKEERA